MTRRLLQKHRHKVAIALLLLFFVSFGRSESVPGNSHFLGVRYFEIPVNDLDRAISFYETLLETNLTRETVDGFEMALFPEIADGAGASGALAKGEVYVPAKAGPVLYITVPDIPAVLERLAALNGRVLLDPQEVHGQGTVAEFEDSEGNRIALFQPLESE